jgi:hypothetical protein
MRNFVLTSTVWVLEKQVHGRLYTTRPSAGNEKDALAELALFRRDPAAHVARAQEARAAEETTPGNAPLLLDLPSVEKFLGYLKSQGRTERHRKNVLHYLAQWGEVLYGKDLRQLRLQDLKQALNGWFDAEAGDIPAKRHWSAAIKAFCSWLREEDAVLTTAEDATLALKVPPARSEKALRDKGYSMRDVESIYAAIRGWESARYGWKGTGRVTSRRCSASPIKIAAATRRVIGEAASFFTAPSIVFTSLPLVLQARYRPQPISPAPRWGVVAPPACRAGREGSPQRDGGTRFLLLDGAARSPSSRTETASARRSSPKAAEPRHPCPRSPRR